jgi:hypothetical protein
MIVLIDSILIFYNSFILITDKEKRIGYADVKSAPVHFYVQRSSNFNTMSTPIPYDLARVNEGNAMNLTSGVFTAPQTGIYFFSFTGLAYFYSAKVLGVGLYVNGVYFASNFVEKNNSNGHQKNVLTLQSTLSLKLGDKVWVSIDRLSSETGVYLYDTNDHFTHFTGFMLEEDIVV